MDKKLTVGTLTDAVTDQTTRVEPEEVLIVDLRGHLSPAEMVDMKLEAQIAHHRSRCFQSSNRRTRRLREAAHRGCAE